MDKNLLLEQAKFWQVLQLILNCETSRSVDSLVGELQISEWELNSYLNFLKELGVKLNLIRTDAGKFVELSEPPKDIQVSFSLQEWLAFQAHFPKISECEESPYHDILKNRLLSLEYEYRDQDLYSGIETLENVLKQQASPLLEVLQINSKEVLNFLEESLLDKKAVRLKLQKNTLKVYPYKIVYFDGDLNLIGEEIVDGCLVRVPLKSIHSALEIVEEFKGKYAAIEVEEFVSSLRAMSENQVRLVLKIHSRKEFSLNFNKMHLEKPVLFTNPQGDFIWAASLEPSVEIYEWLCSLGSAVEILDPTSFKIQFIKYCEDKLKKIA